MAGTAIRLLLAYSTYGNYDMDTWQIVARIVSEGGNIYVETNRYPYAPIWAGLLGMLSKVQNGFNFLPLHFLVKSFLTLGDFISVLVLLLIAKNERLSLPATASLFYLNPVSFLLTGVHGQFDNLAVLPILLGVYFYMKAQSSPAGKAALWAGSSLGMWIKHSLFSNLSSA